MGLPDRDRCVLSYISVILNAHAQNNTVTCWLDLSYLLHTPTTHPQAGRVIAAVLTGVGGCSTDAAAAVPCWRGRLEVRSDDEGLLRYVFGSFLGWF